MTIQSSPSTFAGRLTGARHTGARRTGTRRQADVDTPASSSATKPGTGLSVRSSHRS